MNTFFRLTAAECLKLRRSAALRVVWLLPLLFLLLEFMIFEPSALHRLLGVGDAAPHVHPALGGPAQKSGRGLDDGRLFGSLPQGAHWLNRSVGS